MTRKDLINKLESAIECSSFSIYSEECQRIAIKNLEVLKRCQSDVEVWEKFDIESMALVKKEEAIIDRALDWAEQQRKDSVASHFKKMVEC